MKKILQTITIGAALSLSAAVQAEGAVGIRFGADTVGMTYLRGAGVGEVDTSLVWNDSEQTSYLSLTYLNQKQTLNAGVERVAIGAKVYAVHNGDADFSGAGVAIGGGIGHLIEGDISIALTADLYYSPDIISFGDSSGLTEYSFRAAAEIAPNSSLYIGYQSIEIDTDGGSAEVDSSAHIGVLLAF